MKLGHTRKNCWVLKNNQNNNGKIDHGDASSASTNALKS